METGNKIHRRQAISGIGAGLAGFAISSSFATPQNNAGRMEFHLNSEAALENPVDKYPKPPFKNQSQPWPGLASKMDPRPDHGEKTYKGSGRLKGRKALITGGDSGMGRAAAIAYAREGADVAINYHPLEEEDAREVIALIEAEGRKAIAIPGDLMSENFCKELIEKAVAALKHLKPGAVIIGTASVQAYDPSAELYDYAQTKAATVNYVKSLAKQLGPKGIRVNGVAPGPIWTRLQVSGGATQEKLEGFGKDTPFGRPGQPAELASIYVQLAANDASFSNGQIFGAAGGSGQP